MSLQDIQQKHSLCLSAISQCNGARCLIGLTGGIGTAVPQVRYSPALIIIAADWLLRNRLGNLHHQHHNLERSLADVASALSER